jgi:hypothetical protein
MSDDVKADARRLLLKHTDKSDLSLDAPTSLDDIRERLARCTHGCRCDDGDHENAVHDLASSDVPVLLAAFEDALAELDNARRFRSLPDGYVWQDYYSPDEVIRIRTEIDAERDAALATLQQVREWAEQRRHDGPSTDLATVLLDGAANQLLHILDAGGAR